MNTNKRALITGITGQDGSYLAELLLEKGYEVHGLKRRCSVFNTARIDHLGMDIHASRQKLHLHFGDLSDGGCLHRLVAKVQPNEIYNLGAMSHVAVSFEEPEHTADVNGLGTLRILEAIRSAGLVKQTRFYQASSSELYGLVRETPQTETTPFYPRSPYACAKLYAHWITINYREAYGLFACNGLLFNHESPRRGATFVTRKITRGLARVSLGLDACLWLGNLDALRDWGHAREFVEMQWLMLQQPQPKDYVIATGRQASVRQFLELAANRLGMHLSWHGQGLEEEGVDETSGRTVVRVDPSYFRPTEVAALLGDASRARQELEWEPTCSLEELVVEMVDHDLDLAKREVLQRDHGFRVAPERE
jgi:GDPmannose 4,6-dehydratase